MGDLIPVISTIEGSVMARGRKPTSEVHIRVGEQKAEKKERTCIKCGHTFSSKCAGNRICGKCKRILGESRLPFTYFSELGDDGGE